MTVYGEIKCGMLPIVASHSGFFSVNSEDLTRMTRNTSKLQNSLPKTTLVWFNIGTSGLWEVRVSANNAAL